METTLNPDLAQVARDVNLPIEKVQATVELLDDGNTVPFITRYRKDRTGGLDEEQIRLVHESVEKWRALADRKQRILKSLQAQGKLTDELAGLIEAADSLRRLEDIYLPFKPKKQTLANLARSRGLEPLALEILNAAPEAADLQARAAQFVNADVGVKSVEEVLQGTGHLIAELFSENLELRDELRKILRNTGKLVSTRIEESAETEEESDEDGPPPETDELTEDHEQPEDMHEEHEQHEELQEHEEEGPRTTSRRNTTRPRRKRKKRRKRTGKKRSRTGSKPRNTRNPRNFRIPQNLGNPARRSFRNRSRKSASGAKRTRWPARPANRQRSLPQPRNPPNWQERGAGRHRGSRCRAGGHWTSRCRVGGGRGSYRRNSRSRAIIAD
jgi:protein Tex